MNIEYLGQAHDIDAGGFHGTAHFVGKTAGRVRIGAFFTDTAPARVTQLVRSGLIFQKGRENIVELGMFFAAFASCTVV